MMQPMQQQPMTRPAGDTYPEAVPTGFAFLGKPTDPSPAPPAVKEADDTDSFSFVKAAMRESR